MLTAVYKSAKKADMYLFVKTKDDFSDVPEALLTMFGQPKFVMVIDLNKRAQLGVADLGTVKEKLTDPGFYLQMPPHTENLLDEFKRINGVSSD